MKQANGVRLTEHQRTWLERIRDRGSSGKRMSAYAAEHGLDVRTMYGAKKVLKRKGVLPDGNAAARFQRVPVPAATEWRVQMPNGVTVSFSMAFDPGSLSLVLNTAAAVQKSGSASTDRLNIPEILIVCTFVACILFQNPKDAAHHVALRLRA